jgi:hypothetical protein
MNDDAMLPQVRAILAEPPFEGGHHGVMTMPARFGQLLYELATRFGRPLTPPTALAAAFAVVADAGRHHWPVPPAYFDAARALFEDPANRNPSHSDPEHLRRAPEFVVAFLTGWERCERGPCTNPWHARRTDIDPDSRGWDGLAGGARGVLARVFRRWTRRCLNHLEQASWLEVSAPAFRAEDRELCAGRALRLFLSHRFRCSCYVHGTGRCFRCHNIDLWNPVGLPLWEFCERAAQGFAGGLFLEEDFLAGILRGVLDAPELLYRIAHGAFVRRRCRAETAFTSSLLCHDGYRPEEELVRGRTYFLPSARLKEFGRQEFHCCPSGHIYPTRKAHCPLRGCQRQGTPPVPGSGRWYYFR